MTEINRQPTGLSDFLRVQAGGRNPDDLAQTVRPTIDMLPFYTPDRLRAESEPFSLAPDAFDFIEVPENQSWLVTQFGLQTTNTATNHQTNMSIWHERIPGQGLNGIPWVSFNKASIVQTNGTNFVWAQDLNNPRIVTSGQRIALRCDSADVNPIIGTFFVVFVLLDSL